MAKSKWQVVIDNEVPLLSNEELFDRYTSLAGGDDHDGCYTNRGLYEWHIVNAEFTERLKKIGFIKY